jgi:hypothetical protein
MARGKRRRRFDLKAPEPLEDVLSRAGEARFAKTRPPISHTDWRAAVGLRIAERAKPVSLERGTLLVKVATSVWANELQMLAPELVLRLKQRGHKVEQMRFRVGALDDTPRPPERRVTRKVPAPTPLSPELKKAASRIKDDELRKAVEDAASANLAWQAYIAEPPLSEGPRGARAPRDAGRGTAPPDRSAGGSGGASPRSSGGGGDRRR